MKHLTLLLSIILLLSACKAKKPTANVINEKTTNNTNEFSSQKEEVAFKNLFFEALRQKSLGNTEDAIESFEKVLEKQPNNDAAYFEMSKIYSEDGNFLFALEKAEKAASLNNQNKWYLLQLARMQKRNLKYDESLKTYEKLTELDPKNLDFLIGLSEGYMASNQLEKAANTLTKIEAIVGQNDELSQQKQMLYLKAGKKDKAIEEIEKLLAKSPNEPKYISMLAQLYEEMGEKEKAVVQYKKMLDLNDKDGMASLSLARHYKNNNAPEKIHPLMKTVFADEKLSPSLKLTIALDYIEESITNPTIKTETEELIDIMKETHPNNVKSYVSAGDFHIQHGQLKKARDNYIKASEIDNNSYPIWIQLLTIDLETKNNQHLYDDSKKALELFPTQPMFYLYNGMAANLLKKHKEATETLTAGKDLVIDNKDLSADFYRNLGEAHHELKEYKEADKAFENSLAINPNQPYLLNNYSYYLSVRKENLTRAAEMAKKANNLVEGNPSFEDTYGWVLFQQGKYKEAKIWIKKALDDDGNSGVILEHYGDVLFKLNETEEALKYWEKAKSKDGYTDKLNEKIRTKKYVE